MNTTPEQLELNQHVSQVLSAVELRRAPAYERPALICQLSRVVIGEMPDVDFTHIPDEARREQLLSVVRGVRDALCEQDAARQAQVQNMTGNAQQYEQPAFYRVK